MTHEPTIYDYDIPVPTDGQPVSRNRTILAGMPHGGSYFFADTDIKQLNAMARRLRPMKFTMRKTREHQKNGVRVWRIENGTA